MQACVESCFTGKSAHGKLLSLLTSGNPGGLWACHTRPGKPTPRRDRPPVAHRYEMVHVDGWIMPDLEASQHIRVESAIHIAPISQSNVSPTSGESRRRFVQ
jgi:hypothetical protein